MKHHFEMPSLNTIFCFQQQVETNNGNFKKSERMEKNSSLYTHDEDFGRQGISITLPTISRFRMLIEKVNNTASERTTHGQAGKI